MYLFRLVYISRSVRTLGAAEFDQLGHASRARNAQSGITGVLCHSAPYYLQVLEGPNRAVNRLLAKLFLDPRHTDLVITWAGAVPERLFPDWGMHWVDVGPHALVAPGVPAAGVDPDVLLDYLTLLSVRQNSHTTA